MTGGIIAKTMNEKVC